VANTSSTCAPLSSPTAGRPLWISPSPPCALRYEGLRDQDGDHTPGLPPAPARRAAPEGWARWASRSKLKPFVKLSRTIQRFKAGILAYTATGLSNGLVEGLNNKIRLITRRAFGFHSAEALKAMIHLCCGGLALTPALPTPS
jgi:hypothetical protein